MSTTTRRWSAVAAALTAALALGGCSASSHGATPTSPAIGLSADQARAALLTPAQVGNGLSPTGNDTGPTPFPCTPGKPPLDKQVPPKVKAESTYTNATQDLTFREEIANYGSIARVNTALAVGEKGMACKTGVINGQQVDLGGPSDIRAKITAPVDKAELWAITSVTAKETLIVARVRTQLVILTFGATVTAPSQGVDATGIVQRALTKVTAATS